MGLTIAYLTEGKLWVKAEGQNPKAVESAFAKQVKERAASIARGLEWKSQGPNALFSYGACRGSFDPSAYQITPINALSRGRKAGELLYSLRTPDVGGVFVNSSQGSDELRLAHSNKLLLSFVHCSPDHQNIVCSNENGDGSISLSVLQPDGTRPQSITSGDSLDLAPSWIPGQKSQIVFQSAGLGRDQRGVVCGYAPFAIQKIDYSQGTLETLADSDKYDFVAPRIDKQGRLHAIRKPYKTPGKQSLGKLILDILLFPFRILVAIFHWLNFFSMRYSGKPLHSAGGAPRQGPDMKQLYLWGNLIEAQKESRKPQSGDEIPSLVPKSWELVRKNSSGEFEVLVSGIVSYDLKDDGTLLYSNGRGIYLLESGTKAKLLHKEAGCIEQVLIMD